MNTLSLLLIALILDAVLGEPDWLWNRFPHPATLMGRCVEWLDGHLNHGKKRRNAGILATIILTLGALILSLVIKSIPDAGVLEAILAAILLAQRSLTDHVSQVAEALRSSLAEGRRAVSMIVGRDPAELDESAISRAAIESAAENFSDGIIAPAFWFLIFGLPGIVMYKIINTADSMIGHRNERYEDFGWAAARLDDIVNWVPARLTGGLICLAHWSKAGWETMQADAKHHRSPNAGWPEAAMAGVLGIAISGPRSYNGIMTKLPWVNGSGRKPLGPVDIETSVRVLWRSWFVGVGILATVWMIF
ncbi:cobalamin biosynthesis protein CobD [Rhodobacterales bacterium 52_120_T64]|nr:cobalamin biosynthesis protein CobD [Rhodobacterales bacterium 52_120_T64]